MTPRHSDPSRKRKRRDCPSLPLPARTLLALLLLLLAGPASAADELPEGLRGVGIDRREGQALPPDAEFTDEDGRPVRLGQYFGRRPVVLVFAYFRCPMLCTQVLNGLVNALRPSLLEVGREFDVVVIDIDARERAPLAWLKRKSYVEDYGRPDSATGWHFLTGHDPAIRAVADAAGFRFRYDRERDQFAHASGLVVVTPQGRVSRYVFGIFYRPDEVRDAVREAAVLPPEAQLGRTLAAAPLGPLHVLATLRPVSAATVQGGAGQGFALSGGTDDSPTLLYCFQYDPVTGRIHVLTMRAVRVAGGLTLLGLTGGLVWMQRRGRRRAANDSLTAG